MSIGSHIPLGRRIPESLHAVSASLPTMRDVVGYEEKHPETLAQLSSGYPRFVVHPLIKEIAAHWQRLFDCPRHSFWLTASERMAKSLQAHLAPAETKFVKHRGVTGVRILGDSELDLRAKIHLQHIGGFLSTRQAEDYLVAEGLRQEVSREDVADGDADFLTREFLAPWLGASARDVVLANNGMNAFYAAFCAAQSLQQTRGRNSWIKLGWLYTDTMQILDKHSGDQARNLELLDVFDLDALETALRERAGEFAGIVTEAPTNPLIQTMDLQRIRELATEHGVYLIVDPTVCSPANVDVAPYADIIVTSLTKYAAHEGDVMLGALTATAGCPERQRILDLAREIAEQPYGRDLARLAYQLPCYEKVIEQGNRNTAEVVAFLRSHPKVKRVYWAREERSRSHFERIARNSAALGGLISFEYDGPIATFYDRVALPKGPSFGMKSSLLCPYIYLAHYALVTSEDGRTLLDRAGISPELLRLGVGTEPASEIIEALEAALETGS